MLHVVECVVDIFILLLIKILIIIEHGHMLLIRQQNKSLQVGSHIGDLLIMQVPLNHDVQVFSWEGFKLLRWRAVDIIGHVPHHNLEHAGKSRYLLAEEAGPLLPL